MKIGKILRRMGACSDRAILEALSRQKNGDNRLIGEILLELDFISENDLQRALEIQKEERAAVES